MPGEVAGFTPEQHVHNSKLSRTKCIIICVTLITLLGVCVAIALVFTYATDPRGPGLIVYPDVFVDLERSQIQNYVDIMNSFVDERPAGIGGAHILDCSYDHRASDYEECAFDIRWVMDTCSNSEQYGYRDRTPCFFLVFNEPKNWIPEAYTSPHELPEEMPRGLRRHIQEAFTHNNPAEVFFLWVTCSGENPADEEYLGETTLKPWKGIPIYYFPIGERTSPILMPVLALEVKNPQSSVLITIRCNFWAKNLKPPHVAARFELLV